MCVCVCKSRGDVLLFLLLLYLFKKSLCLLLARAIEAATAAAVENKKKAMTYRTLSTASTVYQYNMQYIYIHLCLIIVCVASFSLCGVWCWSHCSITSHPSLCLHFVRFRFFYCTNCMAIISILLFLFYSLFVIHHFMLCVYINAYIFRLRREVVAVVSKQHTHIHILQLATCCCFAIQVLDTMLAYSF